MKREDVRARVRELRDEAAEAAKVSTRNWWELVPEAQQVLMKAAQGAYADDDDSGRTRVQAAQHILDRAMGTVREMHRLQVEGQAIVVGVAGPPHELEEEDQEDGPGGRELSSSSDPFATFFGEEDRPELMPSQEEES